MMKVVTGNRQSIDLPLRFVPFLRPMVWGGRRLSDVLHKPLPTQDPYGESWEISDHPLHRSVVAEGPWQGRTLQELMEHDRGSLLGAAADRYAIFPWLFKFLDASDWLSVQVHPDETSVKRLWPGEGSKTEAWFVIDAAPGSRIYAGLQPGTDEAKLRTALKAGTVADCLHSFEPQPGDCIFLPAGTVHAVGGGVLMAEIQQTSDATFRLFDWNRCDAQGKGRTLHIEEAIACIDWNRGPIEPVPAVGFANSAVRRQSLLTCPYFQLQYISETQPFACDGDGCRLLVVLRGAGRLATHNTEVELQGGQVWLLPAAATHATCFPSQSLSVLLCTAPD